MFSVVIPGEMSLESTEEARDVGNHPTVHRTAPHNKEFSGQNVDNANLIKEYSTLNLRPPNSQARGT